MTGTSEIPQELLDEMTPAVPAFVEGLLARQAALEQQVAELKAQLAKTPRNSSKPSSSGLPLKNGSSPE